MVRSLFSKLTPFAMALALAGCAVEYWQGTVAETITQPIWPAVPADQVNVHQNLKDLVKAHPTLKVVLRVPNVTTNVTQSQNAGSLDSAYDRIESQLFDAGFTVRDRALLSNLIEKEGITSYKDIQARIDTDLIIDISSLQFNDRRQWLTTNTYINASGLPAATPAFDTMGQAVASVEAKIIIVETGEVGGILTLKIPICGQIHCMFEHSRNATYGTDTFGNKTDLPHIYSLNDGGVTAFLWDAGDGPGTVTQAADLLAQKIIAVLKQQ